MSEPAGELGAKLESLLVTQLRLGVDFEMCQIVMPVQLRVPGEADHDALKQQPWEVFAFILHTNATHGVVVLRAEILTACDGIGDNFPCRV